MFSNPNRSEISAHAIRLIIGLIAICLAGITSYLSGQPPIQSISASYYEGDWPRNIFVGFLIAISAFLLAYHGKNLFEFCLSKGAAAAAFCVATFPCVCTIHKVDVTWVHGLAAAIMFTILAIFCYQFYKSARDKPYPQAKIRAIIYRVCGTIIVVSMGLIAIDGFIKGTALSKIERLVFYGEAAGLIAFGIAWLVASRIIPVITNPKERILLSPFAIREDN